MKEIVGSLAELYRRTGISEITLRRVSLDLVQVVVVEEDGTEHSTDVPAWETIYDLRSNWECLWDAVEYLIVEVQHGHK